MKKKEKMAMLLGVAASGWVCIYCCTNPPTNITPVSEKETVITNTVTLEAVTVGAANINFIPTTSQAVEITSNNVNFVFSTGQESLTVETKKQEPEKTAEPIVSEKTTEPTITPEPVSENIDEPVIKEEVQQTTVEETNNNGKYLGNYKLTAYCNCAKCCGKWSPERGGKGTTKSGTYPEEGRTVGCNSLPLGTHIMINDHEYIVEDTGNMKSNVIDVFIDNHSRACDFGVQYADVYLAE